MEQKENLWSEGALQDNGVRASRLVEEIKEEGRKSERERERESGEYVFTDVKCKWQRVASRGREEHPLEKQTEYIAIEMGCGLCGAGMEAECGRVRRERSQSFGHLDAFALKWLLAFA